MRRIEFPVMKLVRDCDLYNSPSGRCRVAPYTALPRSERRSFILKTLETRG